MIYTKNFRIFNNSKYITIVFWFDVYIYQKNLHKFFKIYLVRLIGISKATALEPPGVPRAGRP
jgi:hypothetical protein